MIEFMVLGAPRSGTAWAAEWLSTDATICIHEPLLQYTAFELDRVEFDRLAGISCTVMGLYPEWVNKHPARKVVLHREPAQVRASMERLGIEGDYDFDALWNIQGLHVAWRDLWNDPEPIHTHLLRKPIDWPRHRRLSSINIQNTAAISQVRREGARAFTHA